VSSPASSSFVAGDVLTQRVAVSGDVVALEYPAHGTQLTYAQWRDQSLALARALLDLGLEKGDRVALLSENRVEWSVVQMATALAGFVLVPVNTHSRSEDLHHALDQSQSRALLLTESFRSNSFLDLVDSVRDRLSHLEHTVLIGGSPDSPWPSLDDLVAAGSRSTAELPPVVGDDPAVIIYTSGTTGRPKGVVLRHSAVVADGRALFDRLEASSDDVVTSIVPMFHSASYCGAVSGSLVAGARYVGIDAFDPVGMMEIIESHRVTLHLSVPTTLRAMLQHPRLKEFDLTSLRVVACGGAGADPEMIAACSREFGVPFVTPSYGLSEAAGVVTQARPTRDPDTTTAGPPLEGYQLRIVSPETGEVLPPLVSGEVQVLSANVMVEYFRLPEATAENFTEDGWLKTGDLGELTPDGQLRMTGGRLKDMIIRGGENIYPVEIENTLMQHPQVTGVAVFALPDTYLGEIVAAAVTCVGRPSPDELAAFCSERIARYKVPAVFYAVDEFPLTASGKIRKTELRTQAQAGSLFVIEGEN
jgi:fatty-acyl-CoA synthase